MADLIDAQGYRSNVGIILMRADGRVFLGHRKGGGWQFPQGGMQGGESPEQALYRELHEEVGLGEPQVLVLGKTREWLRYRLPPRYVRRNSNPVCIGQKQCWFLLRLRDAAQKFRFDTTVQPEFDDWRWADFWEPVREVIAFKRRVYIAALKELGPAAFPNGLPALPDWWDSKIARPVRG